MISPSCPNCRSPFKTSEYIGNVEALAVYACGTAVLTASCSGTLFSDLCVRLELAYLRTCVKELENRCAQLGTEGDKLAAIVDRDYRGAAYTLAWNALGPKGKKP